MLVVTIVASGASVAHALAAAIVAVLGVWGAWLGARSAHDARARALSAALARLDARIGEAASARRTMRLKAETAGRFREEFVAAVRHELNTPLNSILGFAQVLLDEIDGPLTPQQREDVEAIRSSGRHLSELVEAVLSEWAPDDPDTPLPLDAVDLEQLSREVVTLLRGQLGTKRVELRVECEPNLPKPLGDRRRLRQALINLGVNALRATEHGAVTLELAKDAAGVRITVRDTGSGIAAEDLPLLFQEFSQVGGEEQQTGGSGLGLALTRAMVEWHAGRIDVDTKLGVGSAFTIILPVIA